MSFKDTAIERCVYSSEYKPYATCSGDSIINFLMNLFIGAILNIETKGVKDPPPGRQICCDALNLYETCPSGKDFYVVDSIDDSQKGCRYIHFKSFTNDDTYITWRINASLAGIVYNYSEKNSYDILNISLYNLYDSYIYKYMRPQYRTIYDDIEKYIIFIKLVLQSLNICRDIRLQIIYFIDTETIARNHIVRNKSELLY